MHFIPLPFGTNRILQKQSLYAEESNIASSTPPCEEVYICSPRTAETRSGIITWIATNSDNLQMSPISISSNLPFCYRRTTLMRQSLISISDIYQKNAHPTWPYSRPCKGYVGNKLRFSRMKSIEQPCQQLSACFHKCKNWRCISAYHWEVNPGWKYILIST